MTKKYEVHVATGGGWFIAMKNGAVWENKLDCHSNEAAVEITKLLNEAYELGRSDGKTE